MSTTKHQIVIIGAGNAGISVASKLFLKDRSLDIAIVDPADKHYYQPAWTLVGSGVFNIEDTEREQVDLIPKKSTWIKKKFVSFDPNNNSIQLDDDSTLSYDYLVVAPGIQLNWKDVIGLEENLGKYGVCST
jgi:sulfide:quinone oxidoreductase